MRARARRALVAACGGAAAWRGGTARAARRRSSVVAAPVSNRRRRRMRRGTGGRQLTADEVEPNDTDDVATPLPLGAHGARQASSPTTRRRSLPHRCAERRRARGDGLGGRRRDLVLEIEDAGGSRRREVGSRRRARFAKACRTSASTPGRYTAVVRAAAHKPTGKPRGRAGPTPAKPRAGLRAHRAAGRAARRTPSASPTTIAARRTICHRRQRPPATSAGPATPTCGSCRSRRSPRTNAIESSCRRSKASRSSSRSTMRVGQPLVDAQGAARRRR